MRKRLTKSRDKVLAGVFGGIANYFDLDPAQVRIIGAALIIFTGFFPGLVLYIVAAIVMPDPGSSYPSHNDDSNTVDAEFTKDDDDK